MQFASLGGDTDISLVDTMRLTYPHLYAADNDRLTISINNAKTKRVTRFTSGQIRAVDITQSEQHGGDPTAGRVKMTRASTQRTCKCWSQCANVRAPCWCLPRHGGPSREHPEQRAISVVDPYLGQRLSDHHQPRA